MMKTDHSDLSINGESMSKVRNRLKGTRPSVTIFIELLRTLTVPAPEFFIVQCFWQFRSIRFEFGNADQYYLLSTTICEWKGIGADQYRFTVGFPVFED